MNNELHYMKGQLRLFKLPDWDPIQAGVNLKGGGGGGGGGGGVIMLCQVRGAKMTRGGGGGLMNAPLTGLLAMGNGIYYVVLCLSGQAFSRLKRIKLD